MKTSFIVSEGRVKKTRNSENDSCEKALNVSETWENNNRKLKLYLILRPTEIIK
jgi:hypothetical protein